jgi:hypothetical protein
VEFDKQQFSLMTLSEIWWQCLSVCEQLLGAVASRFGLCARHDNRFASVHGMMSAAVEFMFIV